MPVHLIRLQPINGKGFGFASRKAIPAGTVVLQGTDFAAVEVAK